MAPSMNELEAGAYRASLEALAHADPEKPILQPDAAPADVKEWLEARGVQNALALVDSAPADPAADALHTKLMDYLRNQPAAEALRSLRTHAALWRAGARVLHQDPALLSSCAGATATALTAADLLYPIPDPATDAPLSAGPKFSPRLFYCEPLTPPISDSRFERIYRI